VQGAVMAARTVEGTSSERRTEKYRRIIIYNMWVFINVRH